VKLFFDTSVLVPVLLTRHGHHAASKAAFQQGCREDRSCGAHSLAEFCAAFTRLPGKFRADSNDVLVSIGEILERVSSVALTGEEYLLAIQDAVRGAVVGATIYDALLARL
jgi:predicted nucleic acid-binding protein